jgi:phytoene desaturase
MKRQLDKRAVVIGGGLGGLAAGLRLAARGWRVTICEQGARVGGKLNTWTAQGFRFDTGPSLITMPWVFEDLFKAAGSRMQDHFELVPIQPLCDYIYPDGTRFTYTTSMPEWLATVKQLDKRDVDGFLRFMKLGAQLWEVSQHTFMARRPADWFGADLAAIKHMPLRYGWGNYDKAVCAHFHSPYLRQLFNRFPTYVGSSPYATPATFIVIPYIEYAFGGWYPLGGLYRIVEGLLELARGLSVEFLTNAKVAQIERAGGRVTGVRLADGTRLPADTVVMNGDASDVPALLGEPHAKGLPEAARSLSGLVYLFGINRTLTDLPHHSIYFSADYRREFEQLFTERRHPEDPTVYVNAPSRSDRSVVPGAGEALFLMSNAPANDADLWDETAIAAARQRVLGRLSMSGFPDIEQDIVVSDVWTPRRLAQRYAMPGGAIYGTHSHGWRNAFLRPPNKDGRLAGLYYVGGSTHPGGGTPTVLLSAQITSELIQRYEGA